jgi:hypothetical protein
MKIIVIDSEGTGSLEAEEQHDSSIMLLSMLLSSLFVYNTMGAIDEQKI